jgi:uncharacterized protein (DUF1800 family)
MRTGMQWVIVLLCISVGAQASVHDHLFANDFDVPPDAPANANDAARFLTQATFGPTPADIARVMAVGYGEWIDEQLGRIATHGGPTVAAVVDARTAGVATVSQQQRLNRFFWQAVYAPDQLRQRMAFALSQIFVVSDASSAINQDVVPMAYYQDLLADDAFVPYRMLLEDATYSPTMGKYLNTYRNLKPSATTSPDENYAREVMQLFSIGLILRNADFSPVLDGANNPIPTYDQSVIAHTAKVFTGFTYADAPTGSGPPSYTGVNFYGGGLTYVAQASRMACWGTELAPPLWYAPPTHDQTRHDLTGDNGTIGGGDPKVVLSNQPIPSGQTCAQDVSDELDIIAAHQNVAPFISRQLIQRFVTSNPSPGFIQRVAGVFDSSNGDLGDVIKAILLDSEARNPPALGNGDSYGKLREPVLRLTALWRAFNAVAPVPDAYGEIKMIGSGGFAGNFAQAPLESPTVFNFYLPDYQQPGTFADNGLYSPELQITNESTTYTAAGRYYDFIANAYQGMTTPPVDRPLIDLSTLVANLGTPTAVADTLNAKLLYGTMSANMHTTIANLVGGAFSASATPQEKAWSALYVTVLSPEFATQR